MYEDLVALVVTTSASVLALSALSAGRRHRGHVPDRSGGGMSSAKLMAVGSASRTRAAPLPRSSATYANPGQYASRGVSASAYGTHDTDADVQTLTDVGVWGTLPEPDGRSTNECPCPETEDLVAHIRMEFPEMDDECQQLLANILIGHVSKELVSQLGLAMSVEERTALRAMLPGRIRDIANTALGATTMQQSLAQGLVEVFNCVRDSGRVTEVTEVRRPG